MSETSPLLSSSHSSVAAHGEENANHGDHDTDAGVSVLRGTVIATAVFVLIFILTFGISVFTTIQSSIARDLQVTHQAIWFVSAYLIANTSITPIAGKLCQIFSPKSYLLASTTIQAIGLLITAFAPSFTVFTCGRVVCGIGAVAVTPVAFILVTELASERRWGLLWGLINCGYTTGVALGAIIGGELEPRIGWRAVFWIQVPVCLAAALIAYVAIPSKSSIVAEDEHDEMAVSQKMARIDYLGVITLMCSVVLLLYSLAAPELQTSPIVLSIAALALFCFVEAHWAIEPIIPTSIICSRAMFLTGLATIGLMCARWEVILYIPTLAIAVRSWTPAQAGLLLIPTNLGFGLGSVVIGLVHIKRSSSYYISCLVCFALFALENWGLSFLTTPDAPLWLLVSALFLNGFIAGALLNYNLAHLLHLTKPTHHVIVIPLNAMFRSLSGSIGSSLTGGIFIRTLQNSLCSGFETKGLYGRGELILQLLSRPMLVQKLDQPEREVAMASYASSIRYLFAIGSLWVVAMLVLQAGTGWTAPGEKRSDLRKDGISHGDGDVEEEPLIN